MTKRARKDVQADDEAILAYLLERCDTEWVCVSCSELSGDVGLTKGQVRRALRTLQHSGLLVSRPTYLPNGGQMGNAYSVTLAAQQYLASRR